MPVTRHDRPQRWQSAGRGLLDLLFDVQCLTCGRPGVAWCAECVASSWSPEMSRGPNGHPVVTAAPYQGAVQRALIAHKERGQLGLAAPLGYLLGRAVARLHVAGPIVAGPIVLVPCPSTAAAIRMRGQDHARRIASRAARLLRRQGVAATVVTPFALTADVKDQVGLTADQRRSNRLNTVRARLAPTSRAATIIVDDVTTSGSTLAEAERALTAAAWPVVGCAVIARAGTRTGVAGIEALG